MKGIRFAFLSAVMAALCAGSARASEYYWNVASGTWGSYGDTANWLVGGPGGTAATSVPGETDSLCPTQNFFFALGGVTNKVGT